LKINKLINKQINIVEFATNDNLQYQIKQKVMKKLLFATLAILCFSIASYAQPKKAKKAKTETSAKVDTKAKAGTSKTTTTVKTSTSASGPTKKDGTLDMRYKVNKEAKTTTHLKKDGTPDKRYKENKKS
jgi:hypothetical protein